MRMQLQLQLQYLYLKHSIKMRLLSYVIHDYIHDYIVWARNSVKLINF